VSGAAGGRRVAFAVAAIASIVAIVIYIGATGAGSPRRARSEGDPDFIAALPPAPFMLLRNGTPGDLYGRLAAVRLRGGPEGPRLIAPLSCDRVHYAGGWGVCLTSDETRLPVRYFAYVFDGTFTRGPNIPLSGPPIRARVSPDGRRAALTVFETGHSYADAAFSTRTIVIETAGSRVLSDLEDFTVRKDGAPFKAVDFNFWGVTFGRDGDSFFATLKSAGQRYLVKGSIDARQAEVIRSDVECPSLSPDERLVVFKKPLTRGVGWQLYVLDLGSGVERPLKQSQRSVDDQVEWLDDTHIVYHDAAPDGTGIWMLAVDGVTSSQLLLPNGYSPAVQR
jgi:hypothetical protein